MIKSSSRIPHVADMGSVSPGGSPPQEAGPGAGQVQDGAGG